MKKNNRGFTFVELICVIAILGLITVAIFSFLLSGMGMAKETKKSAALSENSRTAISKMKTDIMNCGGGVIGEKSITADSDGKVTMESASAYSAEQQPLGSTFFLLEKDGTAADGIHDTYTISCYRFVSSDSKIYYGRAKNVAISQTLDETEATKLCSPTHVLCANVSRFEAAVAPEGVTVKSEEDNTSKTVIKADRIHLILSLRKDDRTYDTQQDAALRSETRYFKNFAEAHEALGK